MSSGTREDFTGPPDPEPCSCEEALGLREKLDATLARAEAADRLAASRGQNNRVLEADNADQIDRRRAAESRLAEAVELLERCLIEVDASPCRDAKVLCALERFLSATPAPAAESEAEGILVLPEPECRTVGKFVAVGAEHPDTIAIRECRAELERERGYRATERERAHQALESARAERDTALADWKFVIEESAKNRDEHLKQFNALEAVALQTQRELTAALARIAELETALAGATAVHHDFAGLRARIAELEAEQRLRRAEVVLLSDCIARAVAALEKIVAVVPRHLVFREVFDALEALR